MRTSAIIAFIAFIILCVWAICRAEVVGEYRAEILTASWYSRASLVKEGTWKDGKEKAMANGERFFDHRFTCATRLWPLGSYLCVTNPKSGQVVVVKVTDRISKRFARTRVDLSKGAFSQIADLQQGVIPCFVKRIQ